MSFAIHNPNGFGTKCSTPGCNNEATHKVYESVPTIDLMMGCRHCGFSATLARYPMQWWNPRYV